MAFPPNADPASAHHAEWDYSRLSDRHHYRPPTLSCFLWTYTNDVPARGAKEHLENANGDDGSGETVPGTVYLIINQYEIARHLRSFAGCVSAFSFCHSAGRLL